MSSTTIEEKDFDKARKEIRKTKGKDIVFTSPDDETARKVLEKESVSVLLIKQKGRRDRQKQRDSGLDSVMAKIAKKKGIAVGIDYNEILNSAAKEKAEIIARVRQNVKICSKERLKMKFIAKKEVDNYDLRALGLVLGMPTWMLAGVGKNQQGSAVKDL